MQRNSWSWWVLPPESERVHCIGVQSELADELRKLGIEVSEGDLADVGAGEPLDAVFVPSRPGASSVARDAAALARVSVVTVPGLNSERIPARPPRIVRALELASSPLTALLRELEGRRLARGLARSGLEVVRVLTGDRSRARYGVGSGGWVKRHRVPLGSLVIATEADPPPSAVDEAQRLACEVLDRPLTRKAANVFESGKLALELVDSDRRVYFVSLGAGPSALGLDRSDAAIRGLLAAGPPACIRERILPSIAVGRLGRLRYAVEPKAVGSHPIWLTSKLREDCLEFLIELHTLPRRRDGPSHELSPSFPTLDASVEMLAPHAHGGHRSLQRIRDEIARRIDGVPLGGGHGDFWSRNLVARGGRLRTVLDWEWASADSLPLLDLMDLRAQLGLRRSRGLPPGASLVEVLWPLAQDGGDRLVRSYCDATSTPVDPATLEGFAMAHWLLRTARATAVRPPRLADRGWVHTNLLAPLAMLDEAVATHPPSPSPRHAQPVDGRPRRRPAARSAEALILCYHAISDDWSSQLAVRPEELERQLTLLLGRGYEGATISDAMLAPPAEKVVAVTFDDGYRSVFELAFPILDRLGLPGTAFVPTALVGCESPMSWPGIDEWLGGPHEDELVPMSWAEVRRLVGAGWEVGSHTRTHPRLTTVPDDELEHELAESRRDCELRLGVACKSLAYPYGAHDERVMAAADAAGYEVACSTATGSRAQLGRRRIGVHRTDHLLRFRLKVSPTVRRLRASRGWDTLESAIRAERPRPAR
jgi:peptidoglycan/xylan/chitin deacetylase (PgdA/CDA1 family)